MFEPETIHAAVAFVRNDQGQLLLVWNQKWQSFMLPLTKIHAGPPQEAAEHAAIRAASEALLLPTRVVPGQAGRMTRALRISGRDGEIKNYVYTVVPVELHPDFAAVSLVGCPVIWASIEKLGGAEYQPLSSTAKPVLDECIGWGWLPS
jgi:hypothetical protein